MLHGHGRRQRGAVAPPWIFIHSTDIVDRGLTVLFFGLFSVVPYPPGIFLPTLLCLGVDYYISLKILNKQLLATKNAQCVTIDFEIILK